MNGQTKLICVEPGLGIVEGLVFPVLRENGSVWEILLGGEYRKVSKRSGRVRGWKTGRGFRPFVGLGGNQKFTKRESSK